MENKEQVQVDQAELERQKAEKKAKLKKRLAIAAGATAAIGAGALMATKGRAFMNASNNRAGKALRHSASATDSWLRNDQPVNVRKKLTDSDLKSIKKMKADRRANMTPDEKEALKKRYNNMKKVQRAKTNMVWGPSAMGGLNQANATKEYSIYFDIETRSFSTAEARAERAERRKNKTLDKTRRGHGRAYLVGGVPGVIGAAGTTKLARDMYEQGYHQHDIKKAAQKRAAKRGAIVGAVSGAVLGGLSGGVKGAAINAMSLSAFGAGGAAWGAGKRVRKMHEKERIYKH